MVKPTYGTMEWAKMSTWQLKPRNMVTPFKNVSVEQAGLKSHAPDKFVMVLNFLSGAIDIHNLNT
jgi:hypothetical protein